MAGWTQFLPEAQKWVAGSGLHVMYGHPHKKKRHRKIRLHKAHAHNHLIAHGTHPKAMPGLKPQRIRRYQAYSQR